VSGISIFETALSYQYEQFMREVVSVNAINGGLTSGWTSGLIGELEWSNGFGVLVANLSRRPPVDYYGFLEYQRSFRIDLLNGQIVQ
jgi:hypothetical protein